MTLRLALLVGCIALIAARAAADEGWRPDHIITTFWCPPPATDEALAAVAAENYTLTWTPEAGLDVAARHGLRAMLQDPLLNPTSLDTPEARGRLDALVARVKDHPALEAYYIVDEPSAADFPGLGRLVQYLRERDPARLAYINLFPTYASNEQLGTTGDTVTAYREHLRQFIEVVRPDLISYDHYHFFKQRDGDQYFLNLALIRQAALDAGLPFLNIIQANTILNSWRLPAADELRFLVYTTLAYGGRGISYFTYWGPAAYNGLYADGKPMPLARDAARLNGEVRSLSPELMKLQSLGVYHTAPVPLGGEAVPEDAPLHFAGDGELVLGLFGADQSVTTFMVVNREYGKRQAARLRLPGDARGVQEFDRQGQRWRGYANGSAVTVELAPGDGRLFRLIR